MIRPKPFEKPLGVRDYLPQTVAMLRHIEHDVLSCMRRWGYREIITPTLEFYDTVGAAGSTAESKLFKLLDRRGVTMVMRPDLTAPIARVVSSTLRDEPLPIKLAYHANVFRAIEEEAGRDAEFFQAGAEFVGDASPEADAEILALAVACLKAAGVQRFRLALGHVGFLHGLFEEMLASYPDAEVALKHSLLKRDYVGYRRRLAALPLSSRERSALEDMLSLRGAPDICTRARALTDHPTAQDALVHLCEMRACLKAYDVADHVHMDLTMIGDFTYYTGMTFEGYASGLGFPVCGGGRYDGLTGQFGRRAPATGFAIKTDRVLEIVDRQDIEDAKPVLLCYDRVHRQEALERAREMREEEDRAVETRCVGSGDVVGDVDADRFAEVVRLVDARNDDG